MGNVTYGGQSTPRPHRSSIIAHSKREEGDEGKRERGDNARTDSRNTSRKGPDVESRIWVEKVELVGSFTGNLYGTLARSSCPRNELMKKPSLAPLKERGVVVKS